MTVSKLKYLLHASAAVLAPMVKRSPIGTRPIFGAKISATSAGKMKGGSLTSATDFSCKISFIYDFSDISSIGNDAEDICADADFTYTIGGNKLSCEEIKKAIRAGMDDVPEKGGKKQFAKVAEEQAEYASLSPQQLAKRITQIEQAMYKHAQNLEFEEAAKLRDELEHLRKVAIGPVAV